LRSRAFFFPALDLAFFPIVVSVTMVGNKRVYG
jgi:hypothetical protein